MKLSKSISSAFFACVLWGTVLLSATPEVYVANFTDGTVSVINAQTQTVTNTITVGPGPDFIGLTPSGTQLYVPNSNGNTVSVIDVATHTVIDTITVGGSPGFVAFTATEAYVSNFSSPSSISVINLATRVVTDTVFLDPNAGPFFLATTPDASEVYVLNQNTNTVNVISTSPGHAILATTPVGSIPEFVAFSNTQAFVTNLLSNNVSVIDLATPTVVSSTVAVGRLPEFIAVNPSKTLAYVANSSTSGSSSTVSVIDVTASPPVVIASIGTGSGNGAVYLAISPDGSTVYVPINSSNQLEIIKGTTLTNSLTVDTSPLFDVVSPDGTAVYVVNAPSFSSPGSVNIVDTATNTVSPPITVGAAPEWAVLVGFPTPTPPAPSAPTSPTGKQVGDCFFDQIDLVNVIRWNASTTGTPVEYKIFRNAALTDLAGTVSAAQKLKFEDHNRKKNQTYTYYIVAVDANGGTSSAVAVTVAPNPNPC